MNNPNDAVQLKHLDSLASHVNVLGSASSPVDGGLWYDVVDDVPVVKIVHHGCTVLLNRAGSGASIDGDIVSIGGYQFKLTGFAAGLQLVNNKFFAADDINCTTPLGSVETVFQDGKLITCNFNVTDAAAFGTLENGDTISVTSDATGTDAPTLKLNIGIENKVPCYWEYWASEQNYYYATSTNDGSNVTSQAYYAPQSSTKYTYRTGGKVSGETPQFFQIPESLFTQAGLSATDVREGTENEGNFDGGNYVYGFTMKDITVEEVRDTDGYLTDVIFTLSKNLVDKLGDNVSDFKPDWTGDDDVYTLAGGEHPIKTTIKAAEGVDMATDYDATFVQDDEGKYTFKANGNTAGLTSSTTPVNNTRLGKVYYLEKKEASGGDTFTIKGLKDNIVMYATATSTKNKVTIYTYSFYDKFDANLANLNDDDGDGIYTVASGLSSPTVLAERTSTTYLGLVNNFTIKDASILAITEAQLNGTDKTPYTLELRDDEATDSKTNKLVFDSSSTSISTTKTVTNATLTYDTTTQLYTFNPAVTAAYFEQTKHGKQDGDKEGQWTSTYVYHPETTDTTYPTFTLSGLDVTDLTATVGGESVSTLTVDSNGYIKMADGTTVGSISDNIAITFNGSYTTQKISGNFVALGSKAYRGASSVQIGDDNGYYSLEVTYGW